MYDLGSLSLGNDKSVPKPTQEETEQFTVERMKYNNNFAQPNSPSETLLYSKV